MQYQEIEVILDSSMFAHEQHQRSGGLHLSHVIKSIMEESYGVFKGDGMDEQALEGYRTAGFLFEHGLYEVMLRDENVHRIGEIERDGIVMTPDAVNLTRGRGLESKCTFRSMNNDIMDTTGEFMEWHMQMMAYGGALGMLAWDLWVMFMCGDYRKNRRPTPKHWEIEYEQEEVDQNWKRIINHATWMKETGRI